VNCHANTDTSDLLGGLRPLRGRSSIRLLMIEHALQLEQAATSLGSITDVEIPSFKVVNEDELSSPQDTLVHKIMDYAKLVESLLVSFSDGDKIQVSEETTGKRRKLQDLSDTGNIKDIILSIRQSFKKYFSLFEWVDGPLVSAMKAGRNRVVVHNIFT
jgi:midasin